jgi:hypothetical protein
MFTIVYDFVILKLLSKRLNIDYGLKNFKIQQVTELKNYKLLLQVILYVGFKV